MLVVALWSLRKNLLMRYGIGPEAFRLSLFGVASNDSRVQAPAKVEELLESVVSVWAAKELLRCC